MEAGHPVSASQTIARTPFWYKPLVWLALLWFGASCIAYYQTIIHNAEDLALMSYAPRMFRQTIPFWAAVLYAASVGGGLLASMCLLMRMTASRRLFLIVLGATVILLAWAGLALPIAIDLAITGLRMEVATVFIAIFFAWFSAFAGRRGWLI